MALPEGLPAFEPAFPGERHEVAARMHFGRGVDFGQEPRVFESQVRLRKQSVHIQKFNDTAQMAACDDGSPVRSHFELKHPAITPNWRAGEHSGAVIPKLDQAV